jgi:hypothetical protein
MDLAMKTKNELDQRVGERLRSRRLKMASARRSLALRRGLRFSKYKSTKEGPTGSAPAV